MENYRYGRYVYGPDPLADSYDVRGAVDEMGDAILSGSTPADALRELLRKGLRDRRGLDDLLRRIGDVPGLARIMSRLGMDGGESFGHAAAALEFTLEGLYLMRRLSKDSTDGMNVYRT